MILNDLPKTFSSHLGFWRATDWRVQQRQPDFENQSGQLGLNKQGSHPVGLRTAAMALCVFGAVLSRWTSSRAIGVAGHASTIGTPRA
jgi:hypothetical protein